MSYDYFAKFEYVLSIKAFSLVALKFLVYFVSSDVNVLLVICFEVLACNYVLYSVFQYYLFSQFGISNEY